MARRYPHAFVQLDALNWSSAQTRNVTLKPLYLGGLDSVKLNSNIGYSFVSENQIYYSCYMSGSYQIHGTMLCVYTLLYIDNPDSPNR